MRDEWTTSNSAANGSNLVAGSNSTPAITKHGFTADSRSSQGLTRVGRHYELDRGASLNLAARAMKLKLKTKGLGETMRQREVSERRQVGDAESVVNAQPTTESSEGSAEVAKAPWWKNVTPEEGL